MDMSIYGINSFNDYLALTKRENDNFLAILSGSSVSASSNLGPSSSGSNSPTTYSMTPSNFVSIRTSSSSSDSKYSSYGLEWKADKGNYISLSG